MPSLEQPRRCALRAEGSPYVWPRAWTLEGGDLQAPAAAERMRSWLLATMAIACPRAGGRRPAAGRAAPAPAGAAGRRAARRERGLARLHRPRPGRPQQRAIHQRIHDQLNGACTTAITLLVDAGLAADGLDVALEASRLHALLDGLALHAVIARHLDTLLRGCC